MVVPMEGIKYKRHRAAKRPFSRLTGSIDEKLTAQAKIDAINKQAHQTATVTAPSDMVTRLLADFGPDATLADAVGTGLRGICSCGQPCSTVYRPEVGRDVWIHDGLVDFPHDPIRVREITLV